jgi:hypothetical protein
MCASTDVAFAALAANPFGGLLVAVPFGILKLHYRPWVAAGIGTPLAYLQVFVVDLGFGLLAKIPCWLPFLERRRSPRIQRLVASRGAFWLTFVATPFLGPWLVMAFMRYGNVPQRRVALPILLALAATATVVATLATFVPRAFGQT